MKYDHSYFDTHAELYLSLDILIIRSDGVAIIFEVKGFRESVDQALDQILINKYYRILSKEEFIERVKQKTYIGLHLSANKSVCLSYPTNSKKFNNWLLMHGLKNQIFTLRRRVLYLQYKIVLLIKRYTTTLYL
jgi:hypothetical protein